MTEESIVTRDLERALEPLEDDNIDNPRIRSQNYQIIKGSLDNGAPIAIDIVERILDICVQGMKEDMKNTTILVDIISAILKKIKAGEYTKMPNLVPSALAIINIINTTGMLPKLDTLKLLCMETLLSYPDETHIAIATSHCDELMELLKLQGYVRTTNEFSLLIIHMISKLLQKLPPETKAEFLKSGISVWFSKTVPAIVNILIVSYNSQVSETYGSIPLAVLELLTDELIKFDYTENSQWKTFLASSICDAKKYPEAMKCLLVKGSDIWHRMWIVFIKLLSSQITRNTSSVGTPINSMLPVVETAFKMDPLNRCRAFQCWSVLIDIFCNETNENCINKRLKLLIIPLKLNNAKVEITALAKFESWWHLITKFQNGLDKFIDAVLISFLHFCFGKHNASGRSTFIPGQLSDNLKSLCVQAFVEIVGHVNCDGCTQVATLKRKLISTKYLVDYWNDWTHSLKTVIKLSVHSVITPQQMKCVWKSFLLTIGELPDNNIRKDLFNELITILSVLIQDCVNENTFADVVFNVLILSLFDEDPRIQQLLKAKHGNENGALRKIITIITDPAIKQFYQSFSSRDLVTKFKPISDLIIHESSNKANDLLNQILEALPANDITLNLWTALTQSVSESEYDIPANCLSNLLLWPLQSMNLFTDVNFPASNWYTLYNETYTNWNSTKMENTISCLLLSSNIVTNSSTNFSLCVTLAILKNGLVKENTKTSYENEARLFHTLLDRIDRYENLKEIFPIIVDTLLVMLNNATEILNVNMAEHTVTAFKNVLKLITPVFKEKPDNDNISVILESLFKSLGAFFKIEIYSKFISLIADELVHYTPFFKESLKNLNLQIPAAETHDKSAENKIESVTEDVISNAPHDNSDKSKFSTPNTKVPKKTKKKETSIVNTVVENGEEFVVVKSNWKFNPTKLTENQKEKLQRKRDIPALYQDLSQSQDEYKLTAWKTDSQDTITTSKSSSKSAVEGSDTVSILRNLPSSEVLPKIMQNMLSEKDKIEADDIIKPSQEDGINKSKPLTPRTPKTPRMALKDRVFRNMRNLIEKSNPKIGKDATEEQNQIENIPKTPQAPKRKLDTANIINSAPSLLVSERPSRVKRKPKKFADLQLFDLKKTKHSHNETQDDIEMVESPTTVPIPIENKEKVDDVAHLPLNGNETSEIPNCDETSEKSNDFSKPQDVAFNGDTVLESTLENAETPNKDISNNKINQTNVTERCDPIITEVDMNIIEHNNCSAEEKPNEGDGVIIHDNETVTPREIPNTQEIVDQNSSVKKNKVKKSRIEKELAIDMVEGHPFLNTPSSSKKRNARKSIAIPITSIRRKKLIDKLNQSKFLGEPTAKAELTELKQNEKEVNKDTLSVTVNATEDRLCDSPQNIPCSEELCSEDIIESSQDSTLTTMTVIKKTPKKIPIVSIEKIEMNLECDENIPSTQHLLQEQDFELVDLTESLPTETHNVSKNELNKMEVDALDEKPREMDTVVENTIQDAHCEIVALSDSSLICQESKDDTELPRNETVVEDNNETALTADMDTQPISDKALSDSSLICQESKDDTELPRNETVVEDNNETALTPDMDTQSMRDNDIDDVIIINEEEEPTITISSEEPGVETQEIANADTQPIDTSYFLEVNTNAIIHDEPKKLESIIIVQKDMDIDVSDADCVTTQDDATKTISDSINISVLDIDKTGDVSSPFKDDDQRKQDFLNNTVEISPIKNLSPDCGKTTPSPETSGEYVVITLSSPVHSNGEPFEKCSPEVFTDEKISPDKRDQSPPRVEISVSNSSPSSSLSLKKNRPQVRAGGRAAQMLGLCVPETLHTILNTERPETEEENISSPSSTQARRNLRILYNSVGDLSDPTENDESEHFLKLRRSLPAVDLSPSGPILKRKLAEIADDATVSPVNKRKRVSFHDPPVSTTVSVQKYIEPYGVRSPQSSAQKRIERQMRSHANMKSPKRLDAVFKLDSALTKAVESFTDIDILVPNSDSQSSSLGYTPIVQIVRTSDLNDTCPIYPELVDCNDPIANIACELSSPAMKTLFVKVLKGKVETIGDLAKMTELQVNRLCIKAPKIEVTKRVLAEYASKLIKVDTACNNEVAHVNVKLVEPVATALNIEIQTDDVVSNDIDIQTISVPLTLATTQTETASLLHTSAQTEDTSESTACDIAPCLTEKPDLDNKPSEKLDESSIRELAENLPFSTLTDMLMKKTTSANSNVVLNRLLERSSVQGSSEQNKELSFLRNYLCNNFDSKDLVLFCSQLLQNVYDKPS